MIVLLGIRFLAELGLLACLGIGGWQLGGSTVTSALLAVVLPLVAAFVWGRWVAPRAGSRLRDPARLAVEVTLFAAALLVVLAAPTGQGPVVFAFGVCAAFLVSVPSRGHEPAPPKR